MHGANAPQTNNTTNYNKISTTVDNNDAIKNTFHQQIALTSFSTGQWQNTQMSPITFHRQITPTSSGTC